MIEIFIIATSMFCMGFAACLGMFFWVDEKRDPPQWRGYE